MSFRSSKRWAAAAAVLLAAGSLGACGGGDDDAADEAETTTTAAAAPEGSGTVSIEMKNYAYTVSGPLTAGDHPQIEVSNAGTEFHMIAIAKLKAGKTLEDVKTALSSGGPEGGDEEGDASTTTAAGSATTTAGAEGEDDGDGPPPDVFETEEGEGSTILSPGAKQTISIPTLSTAGTYALICFLPTEGEGTPHFAKGMIGQLEVTEEGEAAEAATPTAEYTISDGKLAGPKEIKGGKVVFGVTTEGNHDFVVTKLDDGKSFKDLDDFITDVFEGEEPPAKGTAAASPGDILGGAFDLGADKTATVALDLAPGTYTIACVQVENDEDDDDANDKAHYPKEQLEITVT